jgi:hypothetical protein
MKTIFKTIGIGTLMATFMAIGGLTAFAQDACADLDAINALDTKIRGEYQKDKKAAIDDGKQYLEKYGVCPVTADFSGWLKGQIPKWEAAISKEKDVARQKELHDKFDAGFTNKTYDDSFTAATQYLSEFPSDTTNIDLIVTLGMVGPRESATNKNFKFNANSEKFAKMAIDQLKSGNTTPLKSGVYGYQISCANKDDCISTLTFGIGYMHWSSGDKQGALPYYYQVTQLPGIYRTSPNAYAAVGDYYYETVAKLVKEVQAAIDDQKPDDTPEVRQKKIDDIKAKSAMLNGYTERTMDAYSRAYTYALADPSSKKLADSLLEKLNVLYRIRTQKDPAGDAVSAWIKTAVAKPFPDPTSTVAPIQDDTATTTTTGGANTTGPSTTKPVTGTPVSTPAKPAATPIKPATKVGVNKTATPTVNGFAKTAAKGAVKH